MRISGLVNSLVVVLVCGIGLPACGGSAARPEVKPGPTIPGLNLSGNWYSEDFGDMELVHSGPKVTGKYQHPRGPDHDGRIQGELVGDLLRFEWIQPGNASAGVFPIRGRAYFRVLDGGKKLEGRWGYDQDDAGGGQWKAEKSQFN